MIDAKKDAKSTKSKAPRVLMPQWRYQSYITLVQTLGWLASRPAVRYLKERLVKFQCRTRLIGPGISWTDNCPQQPYVLACEYHHNAYSNVQLAIILLCLRLLQSCSQLLKPNHSLTQLNELYIGT